MNKEIKTTTTADTTGIDTVAQAREWAAKLDDARRRLPTVPQTQKQGFLMGINEIERQMASLVPSLTAEVETLKAALSRLVWAADHIGDLTNNATADEAIAVARAALAAPSAASEGKGPKHLRGCPARYGGCCFCDQTTSAASGEGDKK